MYKTTRVRLICLIMAVLLCTGMFTGCNQKNEEAQQTTQGASAQQETTAAQSTEKELDFVKLTWYCPPALANNENKDSVMAEINKTLKEKINAELDFIMIPEHAQNIKVMAASGSEFDIFACGNFVGMPISNLAANGTAVAVDDLLNSYGKNILNKIDPKYWAAVTIKGKKYASINKTVWASSRAFVFKKDLVEKYKFDYESVKSIKDLEPYLKTIKENEPEVTPLFAAPHYMSVPGLGDEPNFESVFSEYAIYYDNDSSSFKYWWENEVQKDKYKTLSDYYKKGYISKNSSTTKDLWAEVKSQKYAVFRDPGAYDETFEKSSNFVGFPTVETYYTTTGVNTFSVGMCLTAISSTSKNPERAMMLLDLMNTDKKLFNTLCFGLENQDYTVTAGAGTDNPTVKTNADKKWLMVQPFVGDLFMSWDSDLNSTKALEVMKKTTESASLSPLFGFAFDTEPMKNEIAQIGTLNEEIKMLSSGAIADVDKYYDTLKDKLLKAGIENVMKEIQKQYNEWKTQNGK